MEYIQIACYKEPEFFFSQLQANKLCIAAKFSEFKRHIYAGALCFEPKVMTEHNRTRKYVSRSKRKGNAMQNL
jgi:hypothetical protein